MSVNKILIGIDTGVNTGFAVAFDSGNGGELKKVECLSITKAMANINELVKEHGKESIKLYIEDARLRTWVTGGREKAQGVGSVKRDAKIWEDWCNEQELNYIMIHPKANATKTNSDLFKKITGWTSRTNEHARDAAMLVFRRIAKF